MLWHAILEAENVAGSPRAQDPYLIHGSGAVNFDIYSVPAAVELANAAIARARLRRIVRAVST